ncbi:MAG: hypothetical protein ACI8ZB_005299 [Desulforhopalus sp.]|jgi:hypothetical protein
MSEVIVSYIVQLLFAGLVILISYYLAKVAHGIGGVFSNEKFRLIICLLGVGFILASAQVRLGENLATWGGSSPVENFNYYMFLSFSSLGSFLIIFDYCLSYFSRNNH